MVGERADEGGYWYAMAGGMTLPVQLSAVLR
jgi:hypothetical protein